MQVRAADGKKMSKSLKNYPDPNIVLREEGADSLRLYLITSPAVGAANFEEMTCLSFPVVPIAPTVTLTQRPDLAHPPPMPFRSQLLSRKYLRCMYMHAGIRAHMAVPHTHTHVFAVVYACIRVPQVRAEDLNFDVRGVRQMLKEVRDVTTATARAPPSHALCHIS